jgi:hypothetical protein
MTHANYTMLIDVAGRREDACKEGPAVAASLAASSRA